MRCCPVLKIRRVAPQVLRVYRHATLTYIVTLPFYTDNIERRAVLLVSSLCDSYTTLLNSKTHRIRNLIVAMTNPAQPILASSLWTAHQTKLRPAEGDNQQRPAKRRRLLTGCRNVDQGLPNTFAYGEGGLICISSDNGAGGQEVGELESLIDPICVIYASQLLYSNPSMFPELIALNICRHEADQDSLLTRSSYHMPFSRLTSSRLLHLQRP